MRRSGAALALLLTIAASGARAQPVDDSRSVIAFTQTDAWAMAYVTSATLMTGFGETPELAAGSTLLGGELGHIPRLSDAEQRVGLGGIKQEDLNKSPVAGRARLWVGLPYGWVGELGYTPPVEIDGARPRDLISAALGRRWLQREHWSLSTRVHGQIGGASGDITCPAAVAVSSDPAVNPFGCLEPSRDHIRMRYHAAEVTAAFGAANSPWRGHATLAAARFEPEVQIRAEQRSVRNRSVLVSSGTRPYLALGLSHAAAAHWQWSAELLYVPLEVHRPGADLATEAFWSLRLMLRRGIGND